MKLEKTPSTNETSNKKTLDSAVGCNELVRPVRPKPSDPGDGRQRSPVSLVSNGHQTTPNFNHVGAMLTTAYTEIIKTSTPTAPSAGA
jgi:hypothetical protein